MVYKFNLLIGVGSPVGEVISCRVINICFTPKDVFFDVIGEIISCFGIDLNKGSGVV
jgi:hypothetical protein